MAKKNEVVKNEQQLPSYIKTGMSRGNENVTKDDLQLPRIDVLQALSPQINPKKDEFIEGSGVGMLWNTLTKELYPQGLNFTPVAFAKRFLVWVNRKIDNGGGLRGVFDSELDASAFLESQEDANKLEVVPTAEHLVLLDDGSEVILSMAKSKMKVSRKFNSLVRVQGGDRFSRRYHLSTMDDESPKGEFQNFSIKPDGFPSEQVYLKAEKLYGSISSGQVKQATGDYSQDFGDEY